MARVAVVGHVEWVEFMELERMPREGEVLGARAAFARAAGGGAVVAAVLAELGAEVEFFTALGDDTHGRAAAEQLRERGVDVHVAWRPDQPTRRAVTLLGEGERTIVTVGERLEPSGSDGLEWERLAGADGAYFTAGDVGALERARAARNLVASPRGRSAIERGPGIDALVYSARDADERDWARRLNGTARLLVETRGPEGGVWTGESSGRWQPVTVDAPVRDAYGCGDAFAAGFTLGLASGASATDAAEIGARASARCLTRAGAP
jgi:ribokinase